MLAVLVGLGGIHAVPRMLSALSFQFTRQSPHILWTVVGSVPLQQLTQAATLALIAAATVRVWREPSFAGDISRIAAVSAAVLLGIQISANYWNFMYLVWAFPFVVMSLLGAGQVIQRPAR